jgi:hypothetical protein
VSLVCKITEGGPVMCGVEIELPLPGFIQVLRSFFVWVPVQSDHTRAYELAALQAVSYLGVQNMYGFLVVHYSFQGLVLYKTVARASVSLAARATEVANVAAN